MIDDKLIDTTAEARMLDDLNDVWIARSMTRLFWGFMTFIAVVVVVGGLWVWARM